MSSTGTAPIDGPNTAAGRSALPQPSTTATVGSGERAASVSLRVAPPPVRAAFRVLERTAPRLGAWWADRIWFTLPRPGSPPPAVGARSGTGRPFTLDVDGHSIAGEVWGDGPVVFLMHGWAGHGGQLAAFVPPLLARGHRVVTFDAPSHGASAPGAYGPRSSALPEFATALSAVVAAHGPAHAIIAHSMGAAAAAVALGGGLRTGRIAMLAPMASPMWYAERFAAVLGFGERVHRRLVTRIERRVGAPLHHFDVPRIGRAGSVPPALIVHDRDDTSISVTDGAAIAAAWPGSRLHVTSGLGHRRLLRDPDVVAEVVDFVRGDQP